MGRAFWLAFAVCAVAATIPLAVTGTLPAADLPEHMAQVALWKHLADPCHRFAATFELNFGTAYLLGYLVMRAFATVVTVTMAAKLTVWLSIVLLPLSMRALLRRAGADPWLSLLGFLFAYGYVFYWGFLNFALSIPVALWFFAQLYDDRPRVGRAGALALLLLATHALTFVFCAAATLAVAALRRAPRLLVPLAAPAVLFAAFILRLRSAERAVHEELGMWKNAWQRLVDVPSLLFANAWEPFGVLLFLGIALAVFVTWPRLTRDPARWVPFALAMLVYLFAPLRAFGSTFLFTRFVSLAAVGALFLIGAPRRAVVVSRVIVLIVVVGWMTVLTGRFHRFGLEVRDYDRLVATIPANRRVVPFNVEPFSEHVPGPVYWHFGALYQVRRGGLVAWSFANYYPQVVRYRKGMEPVLRTHSTPLTGIDWPGVLQYDYILVRSRDPRLWLFREAPVPIALERRVGEWWLFATPRARGPQRDCPPLGE